MLVSQADGWPLNEMYRAWESSGVGQRILAMTAAMFPGYGLPVGAHKMSQVQIPVQGRYFFINIHPLNSSAFYGVYTGLNSCITCDRCNLFLMWTFRVVSADDW